MRRRASLRAKTGSNEVREMRASEKYPYEVVNSVEAHAVTSTVQYASGSQVPKTGTYIFQHSSSRLPGCAGATGELILTSGGRFPVCEACGREVRFRLLETAPYIAHDKDFAPEA
jgi:hypothetical protein